MTLSIGIRLAHYEIVSRLGAGGMGEVYRARDGRLDRDVAIKLLPIAFANDADRLLRFEQEARATSALNHPNILTIYDIGTHEGSPYIVAELLEGEDLRALSNQGAMPVRKAIDYAQKIASGLAAAHDKGIVHRDLKPENLFVTTDGRMKILDFGLAKLRPQKQEALASSEVATQKAITDPGVVLGTVAYMSPEQVRGKETDHRSDIFSFGVILYEMLRGRRPFTGESAIEVMNAILKEEPEELTQLNTKISPQLEKIVWHCLEKKPEHRFQTASDLGFALEALSIPSGSQLEMNVALPAVTESSRKARLFSNARLWMAIAGFLLLLLLAALPALIAYFRKVPASVQTIRFSFTPPEGKRFYQSVTSPDGRRVAFVTTEQGKRQLWVRSLDTLAAQLLPGTEDAISPFWSPDSRSLGFLTGNKLKKIDLSGGLPLLLCDTTALGGGAWNREGVIIFSTDNGLYKIAATGGNTSTLTTTDQARQETAHLWPVFLPDGNHFVFCVRSAQPENQGIYLGSLDQGRLQRLAADYSNAEFAASAEGDYLLFVRSRALMAQPFDPDKLSFTGEAFRVAEQVKYLPENGHGSFSVSKNGVLVYDQSSYSRNSQLIWVDRAGKQIGTAIASGNYFRFRLSPNDQRVVIQQDDPQSNGSDLWVRDLQRGVISRFTSDPANDTYPIWSPDSNHIVWFSNRGGSYGLYQKPVSGIGQEELLLHLDNQLWPRDWSRDGRFIVCTYLDLKTSWDIWMLPLEGERNPFPLVQSPYLDLSPHISPDGRWLAYTTNESGRNEVCVTTFPSPGEKWVISTEGGRHPQWRRDGKELYYIASDGKLMAVEVKGGASFEASIPHPLFETRLSYDPVSGIESYATSADGQRFLFGTPVGEAEATPLTVVVNWAAEVKK